MIIRCKIYLLFLFSWFAQTTKTFLQRKFPDLWYYDTIQSCTCICRSLCPTNCQAVITSLCIVCFAHNLPTSLFPQSPSPLPPPSFSFPSSPLFLSLLFSLCLSTHYLPFSLSLLSLRSKCFPHLLNSTTFSTCVIFLGSGKGCCMFNMRHVPMWRVSWHCGFMSVPGPLLTGSPTTRYREIWWTM